MLRKIFLIVLSVVGLVGIGYGVFWWKWPVFSPKGSQLNNPDKISGYQTGLKKYDFDSLRKRGGKVSEIRMGAPLDSFASSGVGLRRKKKIDFESKQFSFESEGKRITGMVNMPMTGKSNKMAAILMIRGYADKEGYYAGSGTWRVADELIKAGLATFSIDFLDFGESEGESLDMLEARFEKVPAVMDLLASIKALDWVDENKVGIWAHSNGGQIALSVAEIVGDKMPLVLWAPMTNPFPASILDTASDLDDGGRMVKKAVADFGKHYDVRRYAFENYYDWFEGSVLINQGTEDYWCKVEWQVKVVDELKQRGKRAELKLWSGNGHNFSKNWEEVVGRDIGFLNDSKF